MADKIAPFASLHLARASTEHEFPHHSNKIRRASPTSAILLTRYREKRAALKRMALELAQLEIDLKRQIGFDEGIDIPGHGILYWTKRGSPRKSGVNWMQLCHDLGISEEKLNDYRRKEDKRRFYLRREAHSPEGIKHLRGPGREDDEFGEDL
jgi:hypothetical protein